MSQYIDAYVFPLKKIDVETYQNVAGEVAKIWKEHGALAYQEYVGDDLHLAGTRSFVDTLEISDEEVVVLGWVVFPSKEVRNLANQRVPKDERMHTILSPLTLKDRVIFDASKMLYGGFRSLISKD